MQNTIPATAAPEAPKKRISAKVRRAVDMMADRQATGGRMLIQDAAAAVGLCREHLGRELRKPHVQNFMVERVAHILAMAIPHAAQTKIDLLDSDNAVARDRAASWLLDRAGLGPAAGPSVAVNVEVRAGYILDLRDDPPAPPMRVVSKGSDRALLGDKPVNVWFWRKAAPSTSAKC
jgi:hypothetical protein